MQTTYAKFGPAVEPREAVASCFPYQVRIMQHTKLEKGDGTEWAIWAVRNGRASLFSMQVTDGFTALPDPPRENKC